MRKKLFSFMLMAVGLLISANSWAAGDATAETGVARIGEQYYSTFAKAIADVPATGIETVVELIQNCTANGVEIAYTKNVTLNCNLFTLTNSNTGKNNTGGATLNPVLKVKGTLTLNGTANADSSIVGGINGLNYTVIEVTSSSAKITINSGRYQSHDCVSVIEINQNAELEINGGDFIGGSIGRYGIIINNITSSGPKITINGGRFNANITAHGGTGHTQGSGLIATRGNVTVEINDGLFTVQYSGTGVLGQDNSCVDIRNENAVVAINGGTFINQTAAEHCSTSSAQQNATALLLYESVKSATITKGYFKSLNGTASRIFVNQGNVKAINIEDATFDGGARGLSITSYLPGSQITLNGGYYKGGGEGLYVSAYSNVDILWGKFESDETGIYIYGDANVSISGGNVIGGTYGGIYMLSTQTLTIDGTVNISAENNGGLQIRKGTTNIKGGNISCSSAPAIWVNSDDAVSLNISGTPTITGGPFALYSQRKKDSQGTFTVKIDGGRFYGSSGVTSSGSYGTTTISDGIYNIDPIDGTGCELVSDYEVITNLDPSTVDVYPFAIGKKTFNEVQVKEGERTIDWQTLSTWAGETIIPDKGDNVTIADEKDVEVGQSEKTEAYAHQITVDNGSKLIIDGGSKLTVGNGGLIIGNEGAGGKIIIKSTDKDGMPNDGTGVLLFSPVADEEVTTVKATIELRTTAHRNGDEYIWNYIGIPLKLAAGQFTAGSWSKTPVNPADQNFGTYWQKWDIVEGWQNVGLEAVEPFKGFAITNESSEGVVYTFKGTLVGNQDKQMNFTHKGFNFFANSYTAPIDIEELLNGLSNDVKATIYMFDSENNQFKSVSKSAFEGFIPPAFRVIPIMNGFFILMDEKNSATESVDYGEAVYNAALGNRPIYTPARQEELDFSRVRININSTTGRQDAMYLVENSDFTADFENGYDEVKYMNDNLNVFANTTYGDQSAVFSDDLEGTIISMNATTDQVFTLSFDEQVGDLYTLTDIVTGKQVTMDANSTYTFTADAQNMGQRFMVTKAQNISTDMQNVKASAKKSGVYSITGQYFGKTANFNALPKGVYIINGTKVVK